MEVWQRVNSESAKVSGVEYDLGMDPLRDLEVQGGLTIKQSEYDEADVSHEIAVAAQKDPDSVLERSDLFFDLDVGLSCLIPLSGERDTGETR